MCTHLYEYVVRLVMWPSRCGYEIKCQHFLGLCNGFLQFMQLCTSHLYPRPPPPNPTPTGMGRDNDFLLFKALVLAPPCGDRLMVTTLLLAPPYITENLTGVGIQILKLRLHCGDNQKVIALHLSPAIPCPTP